MKNIYDWEKLLYMGEDAMSFLGNYVSILKKDGVVVKGKITKIQVSPDFKGGNINPSSLPVGFIVNNINTVPLTSIQTMEVSMENDKLTSDSLL